MGSIVLKRLSLASALLVSACADPAPELSGLERPDFERPEPELPAPPLPVKPGSDYLCVETEEPEQLCSANVSLLDAQVEFIATSLNIPPLEECVPTLWAEDVSAECGKSKGCYRDGVIRSTWQTMAHEIVHAMVDSAGFSGSVFMWEGLAEALSGKVMRFRGMELEEVLAIGEAEGGLSGRDYESAGHMLAWMLDEVGPEIVLAIYERLERDMELAEVVSVFEEISGTPFAALAQRYAAAQSIVYAGKGPFSCGAVSRELPWRGAKIAAEVDFSCGSGEDFRRLDLGRELGHSEELWRPYKLDLAAGEVRFTLDHPGTSYAVIEACLLEDTDEALLPEPPEPVLRSWEHGRGYGFFTWPRVPDDLSVVGGVVVDLPAGLYTFWIGWIRDPEPTLLVHPQRSFLIERQP